jgi:putative hydrolase of the HAD superfamily
MSPSRLLLCDLDDTLIDRRAAVRRWAEAFAAEHGLGAEAVDWLHAVDGDGYVDRATFLGTARHRFGLRPPVEELVTSFAERFPHFIAPPEEPVFAGIRRLKADGWRVGVITNGPWFQVDKMRRAGLLDVLDGWCISDVEGVRKPDPAIFHLAAERCGASLDTAWMVGDSEGADIAGAVAAGLRSVWIRLGRRWSATDFQPTCQADSLAEAICLIEACERGGLAGSSVR